MLTTFVEGFLLGCATGTMCLATCGPFYIPYLMLYDRNISKSLLALLEMSAGRFSAYLIVGAVAGFMGKQVNFSGKDLITAATYFLLSVFLIVTVFRTHKRDHRCPTGRWAGIIDRPLVLGVLTGINICPPFLLALTKVINGDGPVFGMILFGAFFLGTSIFLIPISAFGLLGKQNLFRTIARWGACAVSVWFISMAIILVYGHFR